MSHVRADADATDALGKAAGIDEALYLLSRRYGRVFLLLDCFAGNRLADDLAELKGPAPDALPLNDPIFVEELDRAPLLVELQHSVASHYTVLQRSIEIAQEQSVRTNGLRSVCGWLFGNVTLEHMRSKLTKRLDARYPDHSVYFRYFDPRVIQRLAAILAPTNDPHNSLNSSFADLLGPVDVWCHIDASGGFTRHDNPASGQNHYTGAIRFDETSARAIDRIEACNLACDELDARPWLTTQRDDSAIDHHLVTGARSGIRDQEDQVAYAWRAAGYGRVFIAHPDLEKIIQSGIESGTPLEHFFADRLPLFV